jgi:hypothetical protein
MNATLNADSKLDLSRLEAMAKPHYEMDERTKLMLQEMMAAIMSSVATNLVRIQTQYTDSMIDQMREHTASVNRAYNEPNGN